MYQQTKKLVGTHNELLMLSFKTFRIQEIVLCDIIVVDFNYTMVTAKEFKMILDAKCKSKVPILALLERSNISDQFAVLSTGALDYLVRPVSDELYSKKLNEIYKWNWYFEWEEKKKTNVD